MKALAGLILAVFIALIAPGALVGVAVFSGISAAAACASPSSTSTPQPTGEPGSVESGVIAPAGPQQIVMPLPIGKYSVSDSYGWRTDPFTGETAFHAGADFPAADGTPIVAIADGTVVLAGYVGGWGNLVVVEHILDGQRIASAYAHMWTDGIHVVEGQHVAAGDWIGEVGSSGRSTGPHLHLELRPGGWGQPTIDPLTWLADHHAEGVDEAGITQPGCVAPVPA